jgi:hypothetical protein
MAGPRGRVSFVLEKATFVEDCREIVIETNRQRPPLKMVLVHLELPRRW